MRLCRSSILIFTFFTCLGFYPNRASTANLAPKILELAQAGSSVPTKQAVLRPGRKGSDVKELQTQLKKLGYYNDALNGQYRLSTQIAVAKFQTAKNLKRIDGIADITTRQILQAALTVKSPIVASVIPTPQATPKPKPTQRGFIWWSLLGLGILGSIGALLYFVKWFGQIKQLQQSKTSKLKALSAAKNDLVTPPSQELDNTTASVTSPQTATASISTTVLPLEKTSRLAKLNIFDESLQELRSPDSTKRRKAIWDMGQQGDSRAIQPLVDMLIDADSQQRSLILAALAEISMRTLKPMNRALAISLQDESPQVRQNAIRDLTRVYDMMSQMSQVLCHALEDPDAEVQTTARYAVTQMNRMCSLLPGEEREGKKQTPTEEINH
jgi:peptidoglycan hydrolase-like protein with peptidoglycan-binding domain